MDSSLEIAGRLGEALSQSDQAQALRDAKDAVEDNAQLIQLMTDYQEQMDKVTQQERMGEAIELDDKRRLKELHDKLVADPAFKKFNEAQMEYVDLMRRINEVLRDKLEETET
ncbi:MAG: YlbF family regulator [Planctomycetes bacterium]|nr:YlbF family regulator [Planctomycetota bacterium]